MNEVGRVCGTYRGRRGTYKISVQKPKEKRQLRRPKRGWEDNTKMDLQELGWKGVDWNGMTQ